MSFLVQNDLSNLYNVHIPFSFQQTAFKKHRKRITCYKVIKLLLSEKNDQGYLTEQVTDC